MTDNDIVRFALMPKFSQQQADHVISMEAYLPLKEECDIIDALLVKANYLETAHKKILKYGITPFIEDEYSDLLSEYCINFKTQSVQACLEGLSSIVEQIWISIKNALTRLFTFIAENPAFTMWFNRCEFYRVRMANIISTSLRSYIKADIDSFNGIILTGWNCQDFKTRVNHVGNLISKIKNCLSSHFESMDIYNMFGQEINALGCKYENESVIVVAPQVVRKTAGGLSWKPFDVYQISSTLYSKVAVNSMYLTRLNNDLGRTLKLAIVDADNILQGRVDGSNEEVIALSKKRVKNIRSILALVQIALNNACYLCAQWYKMATSFEPVKSK